MDSFFNSLCVKKKIRNPSKEQIRQSFPKNNQGQLIISLNFYMCICFGYRNKTKQWEEFIILNCTHTPLLGPHQLQYRGQIISVNSLTYFRKKILKFEDFVSFDKSTFIYVEDKKLFRLRYLRDKLQLPSYTHIGKMVSISPHSSQEKTPEQENPRIYSHKNKVINNLNNHFRRIYIQILDEIHDTETAKTQFKEIMASVMEENLQFLEKNSSSSVICGYNPMVEETIPSPTESESMEEIEDETTSMQKDSEDNNEDDLLLSYMCK